MRVFGADGDEVGIELNFSVAEIDCVFEVDDCGVSAIVHREREVDGAEDALVGTGVAEAFAGKHVLTGGDLDSGNARRCDAR